MKELVSCRLAGRGRVAVGLVRGSWLMGRGRVAVKELVSCRLAGRGRVDVGLVSCVLLLEVGRCRVAVRRQVMRALSGDPLRYALRRRRRDGLPHDLRQSIYRRIACDERDGDAKAERRRDPPLPLEEAVLLLLGRRLLAWLRLLLADGHPNRHADRNRQALFRPDGERRLEYICGERDRCERLRLPEDRVEHVRARALRPCREEADRDCEHRVEAHAEEGRPIEGLRRSGGGLRGRLGAHHMEDDCNHDRVDNLIRYRLDDHLARANAGAPHQVAGRRRVYEGGQRAKHGIKGRTRRGGDLPAQADDEAV